MSDQLKPLLALAARRLWTIVGTYLAAHGVIQCTAGAASCVGLSDFIGACMVISEVALEGWNRYGTVLVGAAVARAKGVHPAQLNAQQAGKAVAALALAVFAAVIFSTLFGSRSYAADMAVKVPALPQVSNVYPTKGCGMFYGVNAEGGSGIVNGAPAGTVAIGGDVGALVGYACPTSGIPWFVEADFDFQNLNAGNAGFSMKGPAHFSQLIGVQTPLLSWFSSFLNVGQGNIPAITPLLPPGVSVNGAPQNYVAFVAGEDDISSSFAGVSSGRSWLFSPGVRTGLLFNVTGPNGVKAVADTYAGIQFQSNAQCFGIVPMCPKLGDRFVAGFSLKM